MPDLVDIAKSAVSEAYPSTSESDSTPQSTENAPDDGAVAATAADGSVAADEAAAEDESQTASAERGPLPYTRHAKILANTRKKYETQLTELNGRLASYEAPEAKAQRDAQAEMLRILEQEPERFLQGLAQADPRYAALIKRVEAATAQPEQEAPQPNVLLPDGTLGYDAEGVKRLMAYQEQQLLNRLNERFGGIERDWKVQKHLSEAIPRAQAQIAEAENWPGFAEAKAEIHAAMVADRSLSLHAAYIKVVTPKLAANRDAMRKDILNEINGKPRAARSLAPASTGVPASNEPRELVDIAREAVAAAGLL